MGELAIRVEGLSKRYTVGGGAPYLSLRDSLAALPRRLFAGRGGRRSREEIWALKDVSFEVRQGEVLGVIGRNGAGKSTLLKILSRITRPTEGRAEVWGRVGSLLEVGTGFHPELTGRENIWLYGAILGLKRHEIQAKFDAIVAFSEVERFLDTPLKHFSSGMQMRLAFSVAAHLEPEVLLVDEVLAVGDAAFQRKCLGKMEEVHRGGRAVVFVSHNLAAVQAICGRVIWLELGRIVQEGPPRKVAGSYLTTLTPARGEAVWRCEKEAPANGGVWLRRALVGPASGGPLITVSTPIELVFEYVNGREGLCLNPTVKITDDTGTVIFTSAPIDDVRWYGKPFPVGVYASRLIIPSDLLNEGNYYVNLLLVRDQSTVLVNAVNVLAFRVADDPSRRGAWYGSWDGVVRPRLHWETKQLGPVEDEVE